MPVGLAGSAYNIEVTKVHEQTCGCCVHEDKLMRNGDLFEDSRRGGNITCMDGTLYHMDKMEEYDRGRGSGKESDDDGVLFPMSFERGTYGGDGAFDKDLSCVQECFLGWPQSKHVTDLLTNIIQDFAIETVAIIVEQQSKRVDEFAQLMTLGSHPVLTHIKFDVFRSRIKQKRTCKILFKYLG